MRNIAHALLYVLGILNVRHTRRHDYRRANKLRTEAEEKEMEADEMSKHVQKYGFNPGEHGRYAPAFACHAQLVASISVHACVVRSSVPVQNECIRRGRR